MSSQGRQPILSPDTPIASARGSSLKILPALSRLGIATIRDLLFHFPTRYEDVPEVRPVADVTEGDTASVAGSIRSIAGFRTARKRMHLMEAVVEDASGAVKAVWFNQPYLTRTLKPGSRVRLSGKVVRAKSGLTFQNPSYEKLHATSDKLQPSSGLVPVYPETAGITSRWLRYLIRSSLDVRTRISDPLPSETRRRRALPDLGAALLAIHAPRTRQEAARAERRFVFEELLLLQMRALRERARLKKRHAPVIAFDLDLMKKFTSSLPWRLTDSQRRAIWEIGRDMARDRPMNRLLEGDVGSGKTVVAAAASLLCARGGFSVAYMAPTEILARQHHATFNRLLAPFGLSTGLATAAEKKSTGSDITIGTHALLWTGSDARGMGLVIVDEQHRFGIAQRAALLARDPVPHFLSMTATPIPRTLALAVYGDLDLSLLAEMPADRKKVITRIVPPGRRSEAYDFIRAQVSRGRQAFVICPRIEVGLPAGSPTSISPAGSYQQKLLMAEVRTVTDEYKKLSQEIFSDMRVAMLHGRMKAKEKDGVMKKFRDGAYDVLVSTSVIEVGVDVSNATIMMIEGAERFGLAQLHQFRGRVGRGAEQSYCFLFPTEDGQITKRLRAVVEAKNGFELAEKDLAIRGPGDVFGSRQWGEPGLALRGLTDQVLVREAREEAVTLATQSPDLTKYPALAARLARMEQSIHME